MIIENLGDSSVSIQHPFNSDAVVFYVSSSNGEIVQPHNVGIVQARESIVVLEPTLVHRQDFEGFQFVGANGLMEYRLKKNETYRVLAVYRPTEKGGVGFCTNEEIYRR